MILKQITALLLLLCSLSFALDVGDKAPNFSLKTMAGETFKQTSDEKNPTMLIFWATWCPVCKEEIPEVQSIYNNFKDKGLQVLAVNVSINDSEKRTKRFIKKYKMNYPVAFDTNSKVTKEYGVMGTPTIMIIDSKGIIRYKSAQLPDDLESHYKKLM